MRQVHMAIVRSMRQSQTYHAIMAHRIQFRHTITSGKRQPRLLALERYLSLVITTSAASKAFQQVLRYFSGKHHLCFLAEDDKKSSSISQDDVRSLGH